MKNPPKAKFDRAAFDKMRSAKRSADLLYKQKKAQREKAAYT